MLRGCWLRVGRARASGERKGREQAGPDLDGRASRLGYVPRMAPRAGRFPAPSSRVPRFERGWKGMADGRRVRAHVRGPAAHLVVFAVRVRRRGLSDGLGTVAGAACSVGLSWTGVGGTVESLFRLVSFCTKSLIT